MTKQEYAQLQLYIEGAYNNFQVNHLVWYDMLKDYDYKTALAAVKNVIRVSKYPLTIACITEEYNKLIKQQEQLDLNYLLDVLHEMIDNEKISNELFMQIELEIFEDGQLSIESKKILLNYKKDQRLIEIFKREEKGLCLISTK